MGLTITGAVLGLLGLMGIGAVSFGVVQRVNWFPYAPAWWLVDQVERPETGRAQAAWQELMSREANGQLSAAARSPLIRVCLAAQAAESSGALLDRQLDYLGQCFRQGELSSAQCDWFFSKMAKMELKVRPRIRQGDGLTWTIDATTRMPDGFVLVLKGNMRCSRGIVNDAPTDGRVEFEVQNRGHSTDSYNMQYRCVQAGRQKVTLGGTAEVRAQVRKTGWNTQPAQLYHSRPMTLTAEVEVVPAETENVRKVADESLRAVLQKSIRPPALRIEKSSSLPDGKVRVEMADSGGWGSPQKPPMDLAFDILVRVDGQEQRLGRIYIRKDGDPACIWGQGCQGVLHPAVDVILRSSADAARETVDITDIWDGELVYPGVAVSSR